MMEEEGRRRWAILAIVDIGRACWAITTASAEDGGAAEDPPTYERDGNGDEEGDEADGADDGEDGREIWDLLGGLGGGIRPDWMGWMRRRGEEKGR